MASSRTRSTIKAIVSSVATAMVVAGPAACRPAAVNVQADSERAPVTAEGAIAPLDLSLDSASFPELNQLAANEEFGIRAAFPAGAVVCESRSGSRLVGLYADIDRARDCEYPEVKGLVRMIGVRASYNSSFRTSAGDQLPCAPGSAPAYMMLDFREFVFRGIDSVSCMSRDKDGQIWVVVAALGGPLDQNEPPDPPVTHRVRYRSTLGTHAAHLREELALYRAFLRRLSFVPVE